MIEGQEVELIDGVRQRLFFFAAAVGKTATWTCNVGGYNYISR
jgi:hypothetical protein